MAKFTEHTQSEQADMLAIKLPQGEFWRAKYVENTTMRNLLLAMGLELLRLEENLNYVTAELSLIYTSDLIREFEIEYGIPNSCFQSLTQGQTISERINNILTIIFADDTSTETKFEQVALRLGLTVTVVSCRDYIAFPIVFPFTFTADTERDSRFRIIVDLALVSSSTFTFTFPFTFGSALVPVLKCLFNRLKPANCDIYYINE